MGPGTPGQNIERGSLVEQVNHADGLFPVRERGRRLQGCETQASLSVLVLCVRRGVRGRQ